MATLLALPEELLVQFFKIVIEDSGDNPAEPVVLRLSSVCKFLRELVINSPILWSYIRLRGFRELKAVPLFIERSKTCLLDVTVHLDVIPYIAPNDLPNYAIPRWRSLTVGGSESNQISYFVQAIGNIATPELQHVRLFPRTTFDCVDEHVPLFSGASNTLRTLALRGCVGCLPPFPNLTKLNIFRLLCNYQQFRQLIEGLPSLTTLILPELLDRLGFDTLPEPDPPSRSMIEALSLKYFAVGFINTYLTLVDDPPILKFLSMPNLEYLEVSGSRAAEYGDLSGKEYSALRALCLRDMIFPTSDAALYRSFSKITRLELDNVQGLDLLRAAQDEGGPLSWPDLQTVVCRFPDEESCSELEKFLDGRSRLAVHVPVQRKNDVQEIGRNHDIRFLSDEPYRLITSENFPRSDWDEDEDSDNIDDYLDEQDLFDEMYEDYEYEPEFAEMDDEDDGYEDDEDDAWPGF
ncbi:hypothetical protein DFH07DRAFT_788890 [Mycena maculata]|uniref:F-box domain-containing protein n=1 Tax=Mycena maculata TaxID=230809 RepID=A0AAD7KE17_9AGAR|nr:hypothetical protein DFH07DRAFT_788890 [Mycena maculata]